MKWFRRFESYRLMGRDRTIQRCFQAERNTTGRCPGRWFQEASRWRWKERAESWDAHQIEVARKAEQSAINERRKAWILQAQSLQSLGIQGLSRVQEVLADQDADCPLSPADIVRFLEVGHRLEMLARGEATEINKTEHSGKIDWGVLWTPRKANEVHPIETKLKKLESLADSKQKEA